EGAGGGEGAAVGESAGDLRNTVGADRDNRDAVTGLRLGRKDDGVFASLGGGRRGDGDESIEGDAVVEAGADDAAGDAALGISEREGDAANRGGGVAGRVEGAGEAKDLAGALDLRGERTGGGEVDLHETVFGAGEGGSVATSASGEGLHDVLHRAGSVVENSTVGLEALGFDDVVARDKANDRGAPILGAGNLGPL